MFKIILNVCFEKKGGLKGFETQARKIYEFEVDGAIDTGAELMSIERYEIMMKFRSKVSPLSLNLLPNLKSMPKKKTFFTIMMIILWETFLLVINIASYREAER
jgi:hypothetical protein